MSQWANTQDSGNSVSYVAETLCVGSGKANSVANNAGLYRDETADAYVTGQAVGQFGVSKEAMANTDYVPTGNSEVKAVTHAGWNLRRAGQGPIISATFGGGAANTGAYFANGERIAANGGASSANGLLHVTTNATGNIVSFTIDTVGLFTNSSVITYKFKRDRHVKSFLVTAGGNNYSNTDQVYVTNVATGLINAVGNVVTDGSGTITSISVFNVGLFGNATQANADLVVTVYKAGGVALSNAYTKVATNLVVNSTGTTGYANDDIWTVVGLTNATFTVNTNASGVLNKCSGVTEAGWFAQTATNTTVTVSVTNATGGATGGTGANLTSFAANLQSNLATLQANLEQISTGGNVVVTLGGRAGRVTYETLVAISDIAGVANANPPLEE